MSKIVRFELFICLRHLISKKHSSFLSLITIISILGVMIGVMALVTVLSVMQGFEFELKARILGNSSHIHLLKLIGGGIIDYKDALKTINKIQGIKGSTPIIFKEGLLSTDEGFTQGVLIKGLDPETASTVSKLKDTIIAYENSKNLSKLIGENQNESPLILVGKDLARDLYLNVGDDVSIMAPSGEITPFGNYPRIKRFKISGIFQSGMWEYDSKFIYINLKEAQKFFAMGDIVNSIEIDLHDLSKTRKISSEIKKNFDHQYIVKDWTELHGSLFSALKLEKTVMFVILTMIILVAAFSIIATLIMMVMEKSRDIAILKSMGATRSKIKRIFIYEGLIIGALGTSVGLIFGYFLSIFLRDYIKFPLNSEVYFIETLPVKMDPVNFILIALCSMTISLFATLYPAHKASLLSPVEGLRYE